MEETSHDNLQMKPTESDDDTDEFEIISNKKAPILEPQVSELCLPINYKYKTPSISDVSEMDGFEHAIISNECNTPSLSGFSQVILIFKKLIENFYF